MPTIFEEETRKRMAPVRRQRKRRRASSLHKLVRGGVWVVGLSAVAVGIGWFWYHHRPRPSPLKTTLFEGITYIREVTDQPRPVIVHVTVVDLTAPGLKFLVTPGDPKQKLPLRARLTSQFLEEFKVQFAVNAGFFAPWHSNAPWDYYPHVGDPAVPDGLTASQGTIYAKTTGPIQWPTLYISRTNDASFAKPDRPIYNAITGGAMLLKEGRVQSFKHAYQQNSEPRTAIGLTKDNDKLIIVVADGRQPSYSEGVNYNELAEILKKHGAYSAMNLDGGGSSTMVCQGDDGQPHVLNCPKGGWIPNRERPVACHLGIFANRIR